MYNIPIYIMPFIAVDAVTRFWNNVNKTCDDECWEFSCGLDKDGYGRLKVNGKTIKAHRFSYELHNGKQIEIGKQILHSCDNTCCVNPHHLREGTSAENMKDKSLRSRISGEKHPRAKLTDTQAREILQRWSAGIITQQKLADDYKVSQTTISKIISHQNRSFLTDETINSQNPNPVH